MTEGKKYDAGKYRHSLLPAGVLKEVIAVMEYGAQKYGENNWQQLTDGQRRYYDAAMRHLDAWRAGTPVDAESGLHHLAHAMCSLMFIVWLDENQGETE